MPHAALKFDYLHVEHEARHTVESKVQRNRLLADFERYGDNVNRILGCGKARQVDHSVYLLFEMGIEGLRKGVHDLDQARRAARVFFASQADEVGLECI